MKKLKMGLLLGLVLWAFVWTGSVAADRQKLKDGLVRLHIVANSDSQQDQAVKLQVRNAVLSYLQPLLDAQSDPEQAREMLRKQLPQLQAVANETLKDAGKPQDAVVSLCQESFAQRQYDTFTLPAGVYHSLRIVLGDGDGRNWWCVVFPQLCLGATTHDVEDTAAGAGFSQELCGAITGEDGYTLRFFALEALGRLENLVFAS